MPSPGAVELAADHRPWHSSALAAPYMGGEGEQSEAEKGRPDRRMGAAGAPVQMARTACLRGGPSADAVRRFRRAEGARDRLGRADPVPQKVAHFEEEVTESLFDPAGHQAPTAPTCSEADDRVAQGGVPTLQPGRDRDDLLRQDGQAARKTHRRAVLAKETVPLVAQALRALPRDPGSTGAHEGCGRAARRRVDGQGDRELHGDQPRHRPRDAAADAR